MPAVTFVNGSVISGDGHCGPHDVELVDIWRTAGVPWSAEERAKRASGREGIEELRLVSLVVLRLRC